VAAGWRGGGGPGGRAAPPPASMSGSYRVAFSLNEIGGFLLSAYLPLSARGKTFERGPEAKRGCSSDAHASANGVAAEETADNVAGVASQSHQKSAPQSS